MGAEPTIVQHPNLLLNSQGIEAIREKIRNQPWAAALFEKLKASANTGLQDGLRNTVLLYALTGENHTEIALTTISSTMPATVFSASIRSTWTPNRRLMCGTLGRREPGLAIFATTPFLLPSGNWPSASSTAAVGW